MKMAFPSVSNANLSIGSLPIHILYHCCMALSSVSLKVFLPLAPRSAVLSCSALYAIDQDAGRSWVPVDSES